MCAAEEMEVWACVLRGGLLAGRISHLLESHDKVQIRFTAHAGVPVVQLVSGARLVLAREDLAHLARGERVELPSAQLVQTLRTRKGARGE